MARSTAGTVQTNAGQTGTGNGSNGGPITLSADTDLATGQVSTNGSGAGGTVDPPLHGGNAGNLTLRAATGTMNLNGNVSARGGDGGADPNSNRLGGAGGSGGQIEIVAHAVGTLASLSSQGGDGGGYNQSQGPGGAGGSIFAWTNSTVFNEGLYVSADGGNGNPSGTQGAQTQESSPTSLTVSPTTNLVSFTSQSPDADHYLIMAAVGGQTPKEVLDTTSTSSLPPGPGLRPRHAHRRRGQRSRTVAVGPIIRDPLHAQPVRPSDLLAAAGPDGRARRARCP